MEYLELGVKEEGIIYKDRVGTYGIIINDKNEIAIMKKRDGAYFLPGGGQESNETLEECLRRELLEETGHEIKINEKVGVCATYDFSRRKKIPLKLIGHFYKVELLDKVAEPEENGESFIWINIYDVVDNMHLENQEWAIRKII